MALYPHVDFLGERTEAELPLRDERCFISRHSDVVAAERRCRCRTTEQLDDDACRLECLRRTTCPAHSFLRAEYNTCERTQGRQLLGPSQVPFRCPYLRAGLTTRPLCWPHHQPTTRTGDKRKHDTCEICHHSAAEWVQEKMGLSCVFERTTARFLNTVTVAYSALKLKVRSIPRTLRTLSLALDVQKRHRSATCSSVYNSIRGLS